jgi:hypothetical protein
MHQQWAEPGQLSSSNTFMIKSHFAVNRRVSEGRRLRPYQPIQSYAGDRRREICRFITLGKLGASKLAALFRMADRTEVIMRHTLTENIKPRLTEHSDILNAINILRLRGYQSDQLIVEITKLFYVDLDAYNEIVSHS